MREIRTSGLMSGDGKRGGAVCASARAHPRLYLPRPHSWGRSWFDTVSHPERGSRRLSALQVRVPAPRRLMSCEKCGLAGQFEVGRRRGTGIRNSRLSLPSLLAADVGVKIRGIHSEIGPVLHEGRSRPRRKFRMALSALEPSGMGRTMFPQCAPLGVRSLEDALVDAVHGECLARAVARGATLAQDGCVG